MEHSSNIRMEPDYRALYESAKRLTDEVRARADLLEMEIVRRTQELQEAHRRIDALNLDLSAAHQAISRLAGGIAHDFNNVLGAILGWVELTEGDLPPDSAACEHLQRIREQTERALEMTAQLRALAKTPDPDRPASAGPSGNAQG